MKPSLDPPIRIGISACLLGEKVRYDGGHKLDRFISATFGSYFEWVPVCPEAEAGFGTPREPMHLEKAGADVSLITTSTRVDLTSRMKAFAKHRLDSLEPAHLSGYILKSNSPSCGLYRVGIYHNNKLSGMAGRGLFADALLRRHPDLPAEEEGRLSDPKIRENWIQRVFAYYRINRMWDSRWTVRTLQNFHAEHKLILMSHSPQGTTALGRLAAAAAQMPRQELRGRYQSEFMRVLSIAATPARHANVLQHAAGYLKSFLEPEARQDIRDSIEQYRAGSVPLIVPVTLIRHYVKRHEVPYLSSQLYLNPSPVELALHYHS